MINDRHDQCYTLVIWAWSFDDFSGTLKLPRQSQVESLHPEVAVAEGESRPRGPVRRSDERIDRSACLNDIVPELISV